MADEDAPPLSSQLCFDLYAASRAVTGAYRPALRRLGLTYPQYLVLIVLWERGDCTVREIAEDLSLDHGTLTPLLRRMEANGLLTRRRAQTDERYVEVALTEHGDGLRRHATQIQCDMKAAMGLSEPEFAILQQTLRTMTEHVNQQG